MRTATYKCCPIFKQHRFHSWDADMPPPEDVRALFSLLAGGEADMGEDGLRRYLDVSQGGGGGLNDDDDEDTNVNRLLDQIISLQGQQDHGTRRPGIRRQRFTLSDFHRILFSHELNPPIPLQQHVHHDMTLPLSHYFIYTGHNPYHTRPREQWRWCGSSARSNDPIIRALKMGVRAIEIAMFPNSQEDDIIIHHGWTPNTPVLLIECLKSIKQYAFVASLYPVIITLEDNLPSSDLQKKAAKIVLDVLFDILYLPTDRVGVSYYYRLDTGSSNGIERFVFDVRGSTHSNNYLEEFPSPEELKGRVLLSTKPPNLTRKVELFGGTKEQGDAQLLAEWGPEVPDFQTSARKDDDDDDDPDNGDDNEKEQKMLPPLYQHLITIKAGKQKGSSTTTINMPVSSTKNFEPLADALHSDRDKVMALSWSSKKEKIVKALADGLWSDQDEVRRLSCSKQKIEIAAEDLGIDIVRFTQRNILRIYPSGIRLTSSNYNPFLGWVHGAQMVALNMQVYGRALWLMHGFFKANGGCGYVRKPEFLIQTGPEIFDPTRKPQPVKKTLKVKVYMGDGWRMDVKHKHSFIPDFWTRVGIAGVPEDSVMTNTKATERSWVPVWDDEFSFPLTVPEIALLRVEVHQYDMSEKDAFGGQTVLPVSELRPGIRAVALLDHQGNKFNNAKLLMHFEFI